MESNEKDNNTIKLERHASLVVVCNTAKGKLVLDIECHIRYSNQTGRGVFAAEAIPSGTIIETCPVLIFPIDDLKALASTLADHYSYNWPIKDPGSGKSITAQALSLGLGSIFNHATNQNIGFQRDLDRELLIYRTLRDIKAGEELCISYGSHLWFEDADGKDDTPVEELDILEAIQV
jgi:uncharacterized protein